MFKSPQRNLAKLLSVMCVSATLLVACQGQPSTEPPIVPIRNMFDQPRYNPQAVSEFFDDGRTMRPLVAGVVAREMEVESGAATGRLSDGSGWVTVVPENVRQRFSDGEAMLARGERQYNIYCSPCHGTTGDGQGMIARRASEVGSVFWPPTFHDSTKRGMPDGQMFATISNGIRTMPAYRHSISTQDRWAIVAYVRALQLAQPEEATARPAAAAADSAEEPTP